MSRDGCSHVANGREIRPGIKTFHGTGIDPDHRGDRHKLLGSRAQRLRDPADLLRSEFRENERGKIGFKRDFHRLLDRPLYQNAGHHAAPLGREAADENLLQVTQSIGAFRR